MDNFTEQEALEQYDIINQFVLNMGEVGQPETEELQTKIKLLEKVEECIVRENLFSENEELEEINEEFLK